MIRSRCTATRLTRRCCSVATGPLRWRPRLMQAGFYPVLPYGFKTDVDPPAPSDIPGLCIQQRRNCHERRRSFPLTARIKRSGRCWTPAVMAGEPARASPESPNLAMGVWPSVASAPTGAHLALVLDFLSQQMISGSTNVATECFCSSASARLVTHECRPVWQQSSLGSQSRFSDLKTILKE